LPTRQLNGVVPRLETGPLKAGQDWTGLFLRGDEALGLRSSLKTFIDAHRGDKVDEIELALAIRELDWLYELLGQVQE
jgi:hypothetical protein